MSNISEKPPINGSVVDDTSTNDEGKEKAEPVIAKAPILQYDQVPWYYHSRLKIPNLYI